MEAELNRKLAIIRRCGRSRSLPRQALDALEQAGQNAAEQLKNDLYDLLDDLLDHLGYLLNDRTAAAAGAGRTCAGSAAARTAATAGV